RLAPTRLYASITHSIWACPAPRSRRRSGSATVTTVTFTVTMNTASVSENSTSPRWRGGAAAAIGPTVGARGAPARRSRGRAGQLGQHLVRVQVEQPLLRDAHLLHRHVVVARRRVLAQ